MTLFYVKMCRNFHSDQRGALSLVSAGFLGYGFLSANLNGMSEFDNVAASQAGDLAIAR